MATDGMTGRVVIVTGGGGGIGRGLVLHLGSKGASVVVAEVNRDTLAATVKELEDRGVTCLGVHTDVQERSSVQAMVDATVDQFGRVDGLVNNAFTRTAGAGVADVTDEDMDTSYTSIVKASLWGMQAVYPHMKRAGWGRIVNVGSSAGLVGFKGMATYGAAKEAVRSLTRTAAREWSEDGITVNCFCPVSQAHRDRNWEPEGFHGQAVRILASLLPTGHFEAVGDPESEIGPVVAFLLSDDCRYLTGQTLTVDGGAFAFA